MKNLQYFLLLLFCSFIVMACTSSTENNKTTDDNSSKNTTQSMAKTYATLGNIEQNDPILNTIIAPETKIEVLAEGFDWSEGPLWIADGNYVIFSDIPPNKIMKWSEDEGLSLFLTPSGYTGEKTFDGREPGSNGLIQDAEGRLVMCQHGDRRMARMDAPLNDPKPNFVTIADRYQSLRFNSPNDAVFKSNGDLYFTDPPYGLPKNVDDPAKEISFQGVYRVQKDGTVDLLTNKLTRPNGLAFSPDEKTLYVAVSDPEGAIWMAYDVMPNGLLSNERLFYDSTDLVGKEKGLPDGMKVDAKGTIYATGPGGVWIFNPEGKVLGKIKTGQATSNCAIGNNGKALYITADMYLLRVKLI